MATELTYERPLTPADLETTPLAPPGVEIRALSRPDADALHDVYVDAFSTRTATPLDAATWTRKWPLHALCVPDLSYVARRGDRAIAYLLAYVDPDVDPHEGWIGQMGVRVACRNSGTATALLRAAHRGFAAAKLSRAALGVAPDNEHAIRLYESLGYRRRPD